MNGWAFWEATPVVEQPEDIKGATGLGQLRGQSADAIASELEDCEVEAGDPGNRREALCVALSCIASVRKGCVSARVCVFCLVKELLQQDEDEGEAAADNYDGYSDEEKQVWYNGGWEYFASKGYGGWLSASAARHNKEPHALNGNISYDAQGSGSQIVAALVKVAEEYPIIRQPDTADPAEGRQIQAQNEVEDSTKHWRVIYSKETTAI